jgi:hypothetical protein
MNRALRVLSDNGGTIVAGFLAPEIYYVRLVGSVSSALGIRCANQLRKDLANATAAICFFDAAAAQGTDFAARSAIMRAFLANRHHLKSIRVLVDPSAPESRVRALGAMVESTTQVITSAAIFNAQMLEAAPTAPSTLPASGRIPIARSVRPSRMRSMRPRARTGTHG